MILDKLNFLLLIRIPSQKNHRRSCRHFFLGFPPHCPWKHQGFPYQKSRGDFASVEQHIARLNEPLQGARNSSPHGFRSRDARGAPFVSIGAAKKKFRNGRDWKFSTWPEIQGILQTSTFCKSTKCACAFCQFLSLSLVWPLWEMLRIGPFPNVD